MEWYKKTQEILVDEKERECEPPNRYRVVSLIRLVQVTLFPEYYSYRDIQFEDTASQLEIALKKELEIAYRYSHEEMKDLDKVVEACLNQMAELKRVLLTDIQALYEGDPAAKSKAEVVLCYPGFTATFIYRLAHILYELHVPILPRIMTEYAHEKTGIDINPGATIGEYFCIDHGTGIVIGETAVIGHHVKLYQGVTIGAKSFNLDEDGNPIKGGKRHPNIGNHVIIYANATILGGDTHVGDYCVIGGSVWLLHSIADHTTLYYEDTPTEISNT